MVQSLGRVLVVAAGTPVPATANLPAAQQGTRIAAQAISFEALPLNAGIVYVGLKGMAKAGAGLTGELAILPKPASALTGPFTSAAFNIPLAPGGLNAADFYIDADTNGDGVLVTLTVQ